ncbi:hypothetical protein [Streptomyces fructofermentans]|uniref:DUF1877 domain-containing protein n=1 Tax=Streptomyces fructofermentans TaxID=152141 RepID=A0A918KGX7_9ACTN|nr:hypothetical protein [Streptomyces fructofermentans]GGX63344.1 hypothetical protein GCM10010515_33760 [Streptomyces fructofermentans]
MSVSFFWRRTTAESAASSAPQDLLALVPDWDDQPELWDKRLVTAVEFHCSVMHRVLVECSSGPDSVAGLPVYGGEPRRDTWTSPDGEVEEYTVVTVLAPDAVAAAAEVLGGARYEAWMAADPSRMAALVRELGFSRQWDDDWAREVAGDLADLADFYRAAARAGDAVVKYLSC